jgi:WD40 repeat protein
VAFSPDRQQVVSGSCAERNASDTCISGELIVWDVATGEALRTFRGHTGGVTSLAYSPDGRQIVSARVGEFDIYCAAGELILWRIQSVPELVHWSLVNRWVRELTCAERRQ